MDTEETKQNVEEQDTDTSKGSAETVSNKAAEASEDKGKGKGKESKVSIVETPEFKAAVEAIERRFQSTKDKELKPLYEKITNLERERQVAEQQRREAEIDKQLDGQIDEEVAEGKITEAGAERIRTFRSSLKEQAKAQTELHDKLTAQQADLATKSLKIVTADVQEVAEAKGKPIAYAVAKKIAQDSEGNPKLIEYMVNAIAVAKVEEDDEDKRPDSSLPSSTSGKDYSKIKGSSLVAEALKEERNKPRKRKL